MWTSLCCNREATVGWKCCPRLSYLSLGTLVGVPVLHVHLVLLRLNRQRRNRKRPNSYDSCGWKLCKEVRTTQQLTRISAALSMQDKRSAVEGLALREAIGRTPTLVRWCHSEANDADALTKADNRAHGLFRKFLQSRVWRIVRDP